MWDTEDRVGQIERTVTSSVCRRPFIFQKSLSEGRTIFPHHHHHYHHRHYHHHHYHHKLLKLIKLSPPITSTKGKYLGQLFKNNQSLSFSLRIASSCFVPLIGWSVHAKTSCQRWKFLPLNFRLGLTVTNR